MEKVKNKRLSDEVFFAERKKVLATWPTGKDVDLDEAIEYHKKMPSNRVFAYRMDEAKKTGAPLPYTYNGVPIVDWQIKLIKQLREEGNAGLCTTHCDSFTRQMYFERAEEAIKESLHTGKAMLNGFPIPIHGVAACRRLVESVDTALLITGNSVDWRLTMEIGHAGGHTAGTGDPFFCYFCYSKNAPMETTIRNWQYIVRLRGYYEERGCPIITLPEGSECAMCPTSIEDALRVIALLIAAEQGCKHFLCRTVVGLNLAQDLASVINVSKLAREYLDRFGYKDTVIYTGSQSWNGRYPYDRSEAYAVLLSGPLVAALAKQQCVACFTMDEAHEIPGKDAHIATHRFANMFINLFKDQKFSISDVPEVKEEGRILEMETRAIIEKVLEMGDGDVVIGVIRAVEAGVVDTPFSTSKFAARKVMGIRDANGAGRYLDFGNLPFNKEIKDFHKQKIAEREKKQGKKVGYDTIVNDILSVSEGSLVR